MLPKDEKWPFLLRFPISAFGMCLGVSSQSILWKTLASAPPTAFLHASPVVNHVLWYASAARVLPPGPHQLLRAVDRVPVPGAGRAAAGGGDTPRRVVRGDGAHILPGAQDLRWALLGAHLYMSLVRRTPVRRDASTT